MLIKVNPPINDRTDIINFANGCCQCQIHQCSNPINKNSHFFSDDKYEQPCNIGTAVICNDCFKKQHHRQLQINIETFER